MSPIKAIFDYLLIRTPSSTGRLGGSKAKVAPSGSVSNTRIALSFIGIVLGIIASFYVTGLRPANETGGQSRQGSTTQSTAPTPSPPQPAATPAPAQTPSVASDFSWERFWRIALISLVICGITYQGLYYALRLYNNEPALLILFVSFQYGYFWQSVVKAAT